MPVDYGRLSEREQRSFELKAQRYRRSPPDLRELERQITGRATAPTPPPPEFRSFFEDPVAELGRGLDYAGQDIRQHLGKPFSEAATGVAGSLINRGLDVLSFIPREVSPVLVGRVHRTLFEPQLEQQITPTEAKRVGERIKRERIAEVPDIGELDVGLFKITLPGVADIAYDFFTDPTSFLFGAGLWAKASKLPALATAGRGMELAAMAPGLPLLVPLKLFDSALGVAGLKSLTAKGHLNQFVRAADTTVTEVQAQGPDAFIQALRNPGEFPLSKLSAAFINDNKPIIDKWVARASNDIALSGDSQLAGQSLLADLNTAKRLELGIKAPQGLAKLGSNAVFLLKQAWLAPNPAYFLANAADGMTKLVTHAPLDLDLADAVGMMGLGTAARRVGGFSTYTATTLGEGRKPILAGAASGWFEQFSRSAVYKPNVAIRGRQSLAELLSLAEPDLLALGADEAGVKAAIKSLRDQRYFIAKDFQDAMNKIPQFSTNAEAVNALSSISAPGYEDIIKEAISSTVNLGAKATPADLQKIVKQALTATQKRRLEMESVLEAYRQPEVKQANEVYGKLAQQLLQAINNAPNEAAAMHHIALLHEIFQRHQQAAGMVRSLIANKGEAITQPAWRQFGKAIEEMSNIAQELSAQLSSAETKPLGILGDDLRALVNNYNREFQLAQDDMARNFKGELSHSQLLGLRDNRMIKFLAGDPKTGVKGAFQEIVEKHSPLLAAYGNIEKTVQGSMLKQFREQIETILHKRINDTTPFEDMSAIADDVERLLKDIPNRATQPLAEAPPGVPAGATPLQAAIVSKPQIDAAKWTAKVNDLATQIADRIRAANEVAVQLTDKGMFNYGAETRLDRLARYISPFTVWQLRNIPFWMWELSAYPAGRQVVNQINKYVEQTDAEIKQRNLTGRFRRTTKIGEVDVGTGPMELRAEPYAPFLTAAQQMTNPFVLDGGQDELGPQGASQFGALMLTLLRFAGGLSVYPWIWIPLQIAGAFGETPVQDILPTSRAIRGIGELTGADISALDFERNITEPLIRRAGEGVAGWELPGIPGVRQTSYTGDIFRDENIRRRIAEIGPKSGADVADMLRAMNDPTSALYIRARREVERESNIQGLARLIAPVTIKTLSKGEAELRTAKAALPAYNPDHESEDFKLRNQMLKADPGLSAYLDRFDHPAAKEITAQMDDYYSLGDKVARERVDATPTKDRKALYEADPKAAKVSKLRQDYLKTHTALDGYFGRDREKYPTMREYVASIVNEPVVQQKVQEAVSKAKREESPGVIRAQAEIAAVEEAGKPSKEEAELRSLLEEYAEMKAPRYDEYFALDSKTERPAWRVANPEAYAPIRDSAAARREFVLENDIVAQWYAFRDKEKWIEGGDERFLKALASGRVMSPAAAKAHIKSQATTVNLTQPKEKEKRPYRVEPLLARQVRK